MVDESELLAERLLASLPDTLLDRLAEKISSRLIAKNDRYMPSKQVVTGSSPAFRLPLHPSPQTLRFPQGVPRSVLWLAPGYRAFLPCAPRTGNIQAVMEMPTVGRL